MVGESGDKIINYHVSLSSRLYVTIYTFKVVWRNLFDVIHYTLYLINVIYFTLFSFHYV